MPTTAYEKNTDSVSLGIFHVSGETHQSPVDLMAPRVPSAPAEVVVAPGAPDARGGSCFDFLNHELIQEEFGVGSRSGYV